jgi:hypothetical protein
MAPAGLKVRRASHPFKGQNTSSRNEPTTTKNKSGIDIIIFSYPSVATLRRRCNSRSSPQETTTSTVSFCWMGWSSGRSDYDGQRTWWLGSSDTTTTSKTIISRFNFFLFNSRNLNRHFLRWTDTHTQICFLFKLTANGGRHISS